MLEAVGFAADHQAIAAVEPRNAAAGSDIEVVDAGDRNSPLRRMSSR